MTTRRELLITIGASTLVAPFFSFAQPQGKIWRIGLLSERDLSDYGPSLIAFKAGMRELGYTEGKDYVIESRSVQNELARIPAMVAELLALKVDLILSSGTPSALAARNATREIPILIVQVGDPVGAGLAVSLARPGGNVTGLTALTSEILSKRLDLLRQLVPGMSRVGTLLNPDSTAGALNLKRFESDCAKLGLKSVLGPVRKAEDVATAFSILTRDKAQGLVVTNSAITVSSRVRIIELAAKHRLPAIYSESIFADSGALITYSANTADLNRRAAAYAVKIFKGAKPRDLPIEQPTTFDLVLNMKAAKALGIKFPQNILVLANKVIE